MSVKKLETQLEALKERIEKKRTELAELTGKQKDLKTQLGEAKKAEKEKAAKEKTAKADKAKDAK